MADFTKLMKVLVVQGALLTTGGCVKGVPQTVETSDKHTFESCQEICDAAGSGEVFCPDEQANIASNCCWLMASPRHPCCEIIHAGKRK